VSAFKERVLNLKSILANDIPAAPELTKPSLTDVSMSGRYKAPSTKASLPLAPAIATAMDIASYQVTHNSSEQTQLLCKGKFLHQSHKKAYVLDGSYSTEALKINPDFGTLQRKHGDPPKDAVPVRNLATLESELRKGFPAASYSYWFLGGLFKRLEELKIAYESNPDTTEGIALREAQIASAIQDSYDIAGSAEVSVLDQTQAMVTTLSNIMLMRRDTYLSTLSSSMTEPAQTMLRCKPFDAKYLFGDDLVEESKTLAEVRQGNSAEALVKLLQQRSAQSKSKGQVAQRSRQANQQRRSSFRVIPRSSRGRGRGGRGGSSSRGGNQSTSRSSAGRGDHRRD
jgi:hypothetical protein